MCYSGITQTHLRHRSRRPALAAFRMHTKPVSPCPLLNVSHDTAQRAAYVTLFMTEPFKGHSSMGSVMPMSLPFLAFIRGTVSFFVLLILTRLMGKKQLSQLTFFDYIIGITIGSIAASFTTDLQVEASVHFAGLITWTLWEVVLGVMSIHNRRFRKVIDGEPTVVVHNGRILEGNLERMNYTIDDLRMQLRQKDAFSLSEVEFALLEPDGSLSVLKKPQHRSVTPQDLGLQTSSKGVAVELIVDGHVVDANLQQMNLSRKWLEEQLRQRGLRFDQVYYAEVNAARELYVDVRHDLDDVDPYRRQRLGGRICERTCSSLAGS